MESTARSIHAAAAVVRWRTNQLMASNGLDPTRVQGFKVSMEVTALAPAYLTWLSKQHCKLLIPMATKARVIVF